MTNGWIIDVSKSVGSGVYVLFPGLAEYWFYQLSKHF
ncbi:hypothetical protein [Klebsiella phage pKP-BM327-1.1]|nr:hypothetical protein [Klebsiella phage pKP-BM327-1.1]